MSCGRGLPKTFELLMEYLRTNYKRYPARRVLLSTEAVNAGITLPCLEWVISTMGVRRVYYDPRREIRVNVLASQTKASAVQEGGRCGRVFEGNHLLLTTKDEMKEQLLVDEPLGIEMAKLDGLYLRLLKDLPRSVVEELPWMEQIKPSDLTVVYDRLMTSSMITPGLAHTPPGVLATGMELDPELGLFLWHMILGGMPMEGLVWTTLMGKDLLQDVIHPDALPMYTHPEGRPHSIMFPLIYLLQHFLLADRTIPTPSGSRADGAPSGSRADGAPSGSRADGERDGSEREVWQPRYKDGDGELDDSNLSYWCTYVGVTSH
eukprot:1312323-Amphidinium_carterae.2